MIKKLKDQILDIENQIIFLSAVAGGGKTSIIIEKIISLIINFINPEKILVLTYTNEAVDEIKSRLNKILLNWKNNNSILERDIDKYLIDKARYIKNINIIRNKINYFFSLKIQTFHSFCFENLKDFTDVNYFEYKIINDVQRKIIINDIINSSYFQYNFFKFNISISKISNIYNESRFYLRDSIFYEENFKNYKNSIEKVINFVISFFEKHKNVPRGTFSNKNLNKIFDLFIDNIINIFTDNKLYDFLFRNLISIFFTDKLLLRDYIKKIVISFKQSNSNDFENIFINFLNLIIINLKLIIDQINIDFFKNISIELQNFCLYLESSYNLYKRKNNILEFDDIIRIFHSKINKSHNKENFLNKIFEHYDHIIIDEAQDNSYIQWEILKIIIEEILYNKCSTWNIFDDLYKSVFIVGDKKQSIYSFQDAEPSSFDKIRDYFKLKSKLYNIKFLYLEWKYCFRCNKNTLDFIDKYFNYFNLQESLNIDSDLLNHESINENIINSIEIE